MVKELSQFLKIPQKTIYYWFSENGKVPAQHCIAIEEFTKGKLTRYEMRPDVFGKQPHQIFPTLVSLNDLTLYLESINKPLSDFTSNLFPANVDKNQQPYYYTAEVLDLLFGKTEEDEQREHENIQSLKMGDELLQNSANNTENNY